MKKTIPPYYCINWDPNRNELMFYNVMPYLVDEWKEEKKRKRKIWNLDFNDSDDKKDTTKMPETFEEFKKFILDKSMYRFWSRCEYEVIVSDWPPRPRRDADGNVKTYDYGVCCNEKQPIKTIDFYDCKLDVYQQIYANIDVITKHFMDYING